MHRGNPSAFTAVLPSSFDCLSWSYGQIEKVAFYLYESEAVWRPLRRQCALCQSGFSKTGPEGSALEQEILEFAKAHDQVLLGPNGNGFINVTAQLTPYGLPITPPLLPGPVGIVLQSGALASSVVTLAQARNVGLSLLVSMGNETMMSATDVMDYLIEDEATKVIAVFLESIRHPEEFARVAQRALARGKPIVALKIGRSVHSAYGYGAYRCAGRL